MLPFQTGLFHLAICFEGSFISFHGLVLHFFLSLNNIPLVECTRVYFSIHLLKDMLDVSKFRQL